MKVLKTIELYNSKERKTLEIRLYKTVDPSTNDVAYIIKEKRYASFVRPVHSQSPYINRVTADTLMEQTVAYHKARDYKVESIDIEPTFINVFFGE
jgi:hypothetical protein